MENGNDESLSYKDKVTKVESLKICSSSELCLLHVPKIFCKISAKQNNFRDPKYWIPLAAFFTNARTQSHMNQTVNWTVLISKKFLLVFCQKGSENCELLCKLPIYLPVTEGTNQWLSCPLTQHVQRTGKIRTAKQSQMEWPHLLELSQFG